jgi:putative phage-type endonuclease
MPKSKVKEPIVLHFYKNEDCEKASPERLEYLHKQFAFLQDEPQPAQRTQPWYDMRTGMLTASDWGVMLGDNPYSNEKDLILKKCGHEKPFKVGPAILWGVKYEESAVQIYEHRNNVKVVEFGLIQHPEIKYLGASPDGITKDGVMLEIKCPKSRTITGIPPVYYFDQVQGQLEVCKLDRCDFLECKFAEYETEEEYYKDNHNGDYFYTKLGTEKGVVLEFFNLNDHSLKFEYGPIGGNKETIGKWNDEIKEKWGENNEYVYVGLSYWYLVEVSCIPIYRDQDWFDIAKVKLEDFWNRILKYRKDGVEELLVRAPRKRDLMKSKQIFVDTQIDHFGGNMNTDALFDDVGSKDYLFSDDDEDNSGGANKKQNDSSEISSKKSTTDSSEISSKKHDDSSVFSYKKHDDIYKPLLKVALPKPEPEPEVEDCLFSDDE